MQEKNVGLVRFELCADDERDDGDNGRIAAADNAAGRIEDSPSHAGSDPSADAPSVDEETIIMGTPQPTPPPASMSPLLVTATAAASVAGGSGTVEADESSL